MRPVRARCFARLRLSRNCKCWAHCDIWFCNLNCLIAKLPFATGGNGSTAAGHSERPGPGHERPLEEIARKDWSLARPESQAIFNDKDDHPWPAPQPPKRST